MSKHVSAGMAALLFVAMVGRLSAEEVPLKQIVPDYMAGSLETAIIPTPKRAELKDACIEMQAAPLCVVPAHLITVQKALQESGLIELRRKLEMTPDLPGKESRAIAAKWKAFVSEHPHAGWPSRPGFLMEIQDLLPKAKLIDRIPAAADAPLIVLMVEGESDALIRTAAAGLALPVVEDARCAREAYVLRVTAAGNGHPRVLIRGASPWAVLWGLETLRQMTFEKDGRRYIRLGTVTDWPTLWFRGGKRAQDWWIRYKGNSRFEYWGFEFPMHTVARSHNWWVTAKPSRMDRYRKDLARAVERGATAFMIDYNDGGFRTKESEEEPHPGDPGRTVKFILNELAEERKRLGSDIMLGYMGSAYSVNAGANREGAKLRAVDALDKASLVAMNGLEVFTWQLHHRAAEAYKEAFGLDGKLLIYDCQCLRYTMRPFNYRDDQVWQYLYGISAQAAAPIFFITLADYAWNPEAYDPDRAHKLALRELADRDPHAYRALSDYVLFYNERENIDTYMPREKTIERWLQTTEGLLERSKALAPLLRKGRMARLTHLADGVSGLKGILEPAKRRLERAQMMRKLGYKEYRVKRAREMKIDGKLDEAAWKQADVMDAFVPVPGIKKLATEPLPSAGRNVRAWALYDDEALYIAAEFTGVEPATMEYVKKSLMDRQGPPEHHGHCHRLGPTFEIFMKPDLAEVVRWQVLMTVPNYFNGDVKHYFDPQDPFAGNRWQPNPDFRYVTTGERGYRVEARIPFWTELKRPAKGTVWGVQMQLNKMLSGRKQPHWLYWWTFSDEDNSGLFSFNYPYGRWVFE